VDNRRLKVVNHHLARLALGHVRVEHRRENLKNIVFLKLYSELMIFFAIF
jgi:hypothetical protein